MLDPKKLIGTHVGAYYLEKFIDGGGFGYVFKSTHKCKDGTTIPAGIKIQPLDNLPMVDSTDPLHPYPKPYLNLVINALTFWKEQRHTHILALHHVELVRIDGIECLIWVMDLAECSLKDILKQRQLTADETIEMGRQIASALCYMHDQDLVHRDIKAANILYRDGIYLLSDFDTLRREGQTVVVGTKENLPPEGFMGIVSKAGDMHTLGRVLLQASTGDLNGNTAALPPPLRDAINGCVRPVPSSRLTAAQLRDALDLFHSSMPVPLAAALVVLALAAAFYSLAVSAGYSSTGNPPSQTRSHPGRANSYSATLRASPFYWQGGVAKQIAKRDHLSPVAGSEEEWV